MPFPERFTTYMLDVAGVGQETIERVREAWKVFSAIAPPAPTDMLIGDYLTADGSRELEELWFFNPTASMVLVEFMGDRSQPANYDVVPMIGHSLGAYRATATDYLLEEGPPSEAEGNSVPMVRRWTEHSVLQVDYELAGAPGSTGHMRACRGNCDALLSIVERYFGSWATGEAANGIRN